MAKTLTIKDVVYQDLLKVKDGDESFSDLFERLMKSMDPIEVLRKIRGSVEFKDKGRMLSELYSKRSEVRP